MKKILLLLTIGILGIGNAQIGNVGINIDEPQATLDVVGFPDDTSKMDGIIAPRITGEKLGDKTYTSTQTGALVYATVADPSPQGQTINVTSPGYYYFDGTVWVAMKVGSNYHKLRLTTANPIVIAPDDYTIGYMGRNNVSTTLPSAASNPQRIIRLCALDGYGGSILINGLASSQFPGGSSYVASSTNNNQTCYQIQSDGNEWYVIGSFR